MVDLINFPCTIPDIAVGTTGRWAITSNAALCVYPVVNNTIKKRKNITGRGMYRWRTIDSGNA